MALVEKIRIFELCETGVWFSVFGFLYRVLIQRLIQRWLVNLATRLPQWLAPLRSRTFGRHRHCGAVTGTVNGGICWRENFFLIRTCTVVRYIIHTSLSHSFWSTRRGKLPNSARLYTLRSPVDAQAQGAESRIGFLTSLFLLHTAAASGFPIRSEHNQPNSVPNALPDLKNFHIYWWIFTVSHTV